MSVADAEDRQWVAAVAGSGDESAFRALYRRHTPALYRLALRLGGGDPTWADELTQSAWIRAVESLSGFAWRSTFRTWLSGIVVNCAREQWRTVRADGEIALDPELAASAGAGDIGAGIDLERAVARLPHGCRQVFVLHDVEGFTHDEVAGMLGIESGTSKSQLSHARRRLRELLAPPGPRIERRSNG